jgi:hypothetical protein
MEELRVLDPRWRANYSARRLGDFCAALSRAQTGGVAGIRIVSSQYILGVAAEAGGKLKPKLMFHSGPQIVGMLGTLGTLGNGSCG